VNLRFCNSEPLHNRVSMSIFCLSHNLIYLLYFCPSWDRS